MKYSFLIPSKNRLELLKHAVESIRRQPIKNYEIVIADNASEQDYRAYISAIGDTRIIYRRATRAVPVTENWNNALAMASGDYVLMLGDDDALTPLFSQRVSSLVTAANAPDIVYLAAYHYCYPRVLPRHPTGYLADVRNSRFLAGKTEPFQLPREEAIAVAKGAFDFRYFFGFNSQHFLFRAEFLRRLSEVGGIFQSPYPDTFAAVVSFLEAHSIMVVPQPTVIIGISPKSFGYYYFNDRLIEGYRFLDNEEVSPDVRQALESVTLPGDRNNTNWLIAVEVARRALARDYGLEVGVRRYRVLQLVAFLRDIYLKKVRRAGEIEEFVERLDDDERALFAGLQATVAGAISRGRGRLIGAFEAIDRELGQFWPAQVGMMSIRRHSNITDAFEWLTKNPRARGSPTGRSRWKHLLRRLVTR